MSQDNANNNNTMAAGGKSIEEVAPLFKNLGGLSPVRPVIMNSLLTPQQQFQLSQQDQARATSPARGGSATREESPSVPGRKHTPNEVLAHMNDISGTISELMHENVYLRTKLLSAKSATWKWMFAAEMGTAGLFTQWALHTKAEKRKQIEAQMNKGLAEKDAATKARVTEINKLADMRRSELEAKCTETENELEETKAALTAELATLKKELETQKAKNGQFQKAFHAVHDQLALATKEFLDDEQHEVDTTVYDISHPDNKKNKAATNGAMTNGTSAKDGESNIAGESKATAFENAEATVQLHDLPLTPRAEQLAVNEYIVENLHNLLHAVDGRYVRPLSVGLKKRNAHGSTIKQALGVADRVCPAAVAVRDAASRGQALLASQQQQNEKEKNSTNGATPAMAAGAATPGVPGLAAAGRIAPPTKPLQAPALPDITFQFHAAESATLLDMNNDLVKAMNGNVDQIQTQNDFNNNVTGGATQHPTRCVIIRNALAYNPQTTPASEFDEVKEDMELGAKEYGETLNTRIVKPEHLAFLRTNGEMDATVGTVLLEFADAATAGKVIAEMHDGDYDGQVLNLTYYDEERFHRYITRL